MIEFIKIIFKFFAKSLPGFIGEYWQPILSAVITAAICYNVHSCEMTKADKVKADAVAAEKKQNESDCQAAKLFTGGNSNVFQSDLSKDHSYNDDLYNSIVMRNGGKAASACIPITRAGGGLDATAKAGAVGVEANGIPIIAILGIIKHRDDLYDQANRKLQACQRHAAEIEKIGLNCH